MRSATFLCALFVLPGYALAEEAPVTTAPAMASPAPAGDTSAPVPPPAAVAPAPIPAPPTPCPVVAAQPIGPEPAIGWSRGRRAPMYASLMLGAGLLGEDKDNRLTTRDSKALEGVTGILRVGATLSDHSRVGARMQSFVRPTKKLVYDTPPADGKTDKWGTVSFGYVGPEYLYTTDFGLYFGGSIGFAAAASERDIENRDDHKHDHIERGAAGIGSVISVGYEWRLSKWFAMNAEVYAGGYSAFDDNEDNMKGGITGFAMGAGF